MLVKPLTIGVTMLGTADVVMLAGGELRPAESGKQTQTAHCTLVQFPNKVCKKSAISYYSRENVHVNI